MEAFSNMGSGMPLVNLRVQALTVPRSPVLGLMERIVQRLEPERLGKGC
jgi:hypothetical protein